MPIQFLFFNRGLLIPVLFCMLVTVNSVRAFEAENSKSGLPLWEWGIAVGGGFVPDYPGSEEASLRGFPAPFFIYRGRVMRSDSGGLRGRLINNLLYEFSFSFSGAFPVNADDNKARNGMEDLDLMLQFGPSILLKLPSLSETKKDEFRVQLALRGVLSTDFGGFNYRGAVFHPRIYYKISNLLWNGTRTFVGIGSQFATDRLMDYFYAVPRPFVTPTRRFYDAKTGYLQSSLSMWQSNRIHKNWFFIIGGRVTSLHGARNVESDLLIDKWNYGVFSAIAWYIGASEKTVTD